MKTIPFLLLTLLFAPIAFGQGEAPGTVKATTKLRGDGSMSTTVVDPDKRTAEEIFSDASGKMLKKTVFTLDENNFATGATYYDGKGKIRYKERYKHDAEHRIAESELFSAADQALGRRVFTYDSRGKARVEDYDAAGNLIVQSGRGSKPAKAPTVRRAAPVR